MGFGPVDGASWYGQWSPGALPTLTSPVCLLRLTVAADFKWSAQVCVQAIAPDGGPLRLATQYGVWGRPGGARSGSFNYYTPPCPARIRAASVATDLRMSAQAADYWSAATDLKWSAQDRPLRALRACNATALATDLRWSAQVCLQNTHMRLVPRALAKVMRLAVAADLKWSAQVCALPTQRHCGRDGE